jgi:D-sedoheptulose 7-phosphate isomerase
MVDFSFQYIHDSIIILEAMTINETCENIENMVRGLSAVRKSEGRLFILGIGGSAGHSSHAVNDFRKICGIESYAPTDNVSELTARANDEGWDSIFSEWLKGSNFNKNDALLVFSVGGGDIEKNVSVPICKAVDYAWSFGPGTIYAILGRDGGYVAQKADVSIIIPPLFPERITPHTEGITAIIWHLIVSHPSLKISQTKWESIDIVNV